jgi:ethanolamine utilization protein EutQ
VTNLIHQPTVIMAAEECNEIAEYVGRLNSATESLSIAHMKSPAGWSEPGQTRSSMNIPWYCAGLSVRKLAWVCWLRPNSEWSVSQSSN